MEDKTQANEVKLFHEAYRNKRTNIYRLFLNLPTWVGMKIIEIKIDGSKVKWNLLAECIYQGNNQDVSRLYSEVVLTNINEWVKLDSVESFIHCIECIEEHCLTCDNFIFSQTID